MMIGFGISCCSNYFYGPLCIERSYPSFFLEWLLKMKVNMWLQNKKVKNYDNWELCAFTAILRLSTFLVNAPAKSF